MPTLSSFYGILIKMYREIGGSHNLPHFHAEYQDDEAVISFDGGLLEGDLPSKKLRMVQTWADIHREELEKNWDILQKGGEFFKIEPLR